jgi:hypothetical protein
LPTALAAPEDVGTMFSIPARMAAEKHQFIKMGQPV